MKLVSQVHLKLAPMTSMKHLTPSYPTLSFTVETKVERLFVTLKNKYFQDNEKLSEAMNLHTRMNIY